MNYPPEAPPLKTEHRVPAEWLRVKTEKKEGSR